MIPIFARPNMQAVIRVAAANVAVGKGETTQKKIRWGEAVVRVSGRGCQWRALRVSEMAIGSAKSQRSGKGLIRPGVGEKGEADYATPEV